MTKWWPYARALFALLGAAAVVAQLMKTLQNAHEATTEWGSHLPTVISNFLSFFTIDSNVLAAIVLAVGAVWAWTSGRDKLPGAPVRPGRRVSNQESNQEPVWLAVMLASVSTYMIVTGVVFNLLLRGIELPQGQTVPWSNEVLHVVFPLFLLADVLFAPRRRVLPWRAVFAVLIFPILWVTYTLVRAEHIVSPSTGDHWWYPYPFLNPHVVPGGYGGVAMYVVGIAVAIIGVAMFVVWIGRRRGKLAPLGRS